MASIRKRGDSYLIVVSMGYDYNGNRRKAQQKTVRPPEGLTTKQRDKWVNEQAVLFERECKDTPQTVDKSVTLAEYTELWLREIAPHKLAKSTLARDRQDIDRFLPYLGHYKLTDLRPEHFRKLYAELREMRSQNTGKPLSECTIEGVHACLCGILSDAMEGGFLDHNPAWRTYRYTGKKKEKIIADEKTVQKLIVALEDESIKYETYFKLIIATGMRRGECCGLKWSDINYDEHSIHIQRNVVKLSGEEIIVKETKTAAGDRYVYFSPEMGTLLKEYRKECDWQADAYENFQLNDDDYIFRRHETRLPMTPNSFTWRFKLILKKNGLPTKLNVHSLRHTNASLLIASGTDVATVAGLLGHSQPSTTLDIYTHAFDKNKKAASEKLQKGLEI
jgi:integrase